MTSRKNRANEPRTAGAQQTGTGRLGPVREPLSVGDSEQADVDVRLLDRGMRLGLPFTLRVGGGMGTDMDAGSVCGCGLALALR